MAKLSEKHKANLKLQEERRLEKERKRLLSMTGGFSLDGYVSSSKTKAKAKVAYRNFEGRLPAKPDPVHIAKSKAALSEEMRARELLAQEEIKLKKSLCMPLYNKGGMAYPTETDLIAFKNGELRRRS